jgi:hypothetical protein
MPSAIRTYLCGLLLLSAFTMQAQDKILKLNGRTIDIKSYSLQRDWLFYVKEKNKKEVRRRIDRYEVFSVIKSDGSEEIIYDPDTLYDGDPTIEQVRRYIRGEQYAMQVYQPNWTKPAGVAAGIGSGFIGFYGPPLVFGYVLVASAFPARHIPPSADISPEVFYSDEFIAGYRKYARNKKIRDGLIWGGVSFLASFTAFYLIFHDI